VLYGSALQQASAADGMAVLSVSRIADP
jgi:hypothetical protein